MNLFIIRSYDYPLIHQRLAVLWHPVKHPVIPKSIEEQSLNETEMNSG